MRLWIPVALSLLMLLGAASAQGSRDATAAGPGYALSGATITYDSPPLTTTRYHVTTTFSGVVCGDPQTAAWTITYTKAGYPSELQPRTVTVTFATNNPAAITADRWLDANRNELARIEMRLRLTPGASPVLTPEWTVTGDIENVTDVPQQATAQTIAECPAAAPPPPPPPTPPSPPPPPKNVVVTGGPTPGRAPGAVKLPGLSRFVPITSGQALPSGSTLDVSNGKGIQLTDGKGGKLDIYGEKDGVPSLARIVRTAGLVELQLTGGNFKSCAKRMLSNAAKVEKPVRRLWAKGKGKFRTKGRFISGAIRGTWWETRDFCDRSGVRVREGTVTATNLVTGKKKAVPKGQIYSVPKP